MDNPRPCPFCQLAEIPAYRAMCSACFEVMPWKIRSSMLYAHRIRVQHPIYYQETMAKAKEQLMEQSVQNRREWKEGH